MNIDDGVWSHCIDQVAQDLGWPHADSRWLIKHAIQRIGLTVRGVIAAIVAESRHLS